MNKTFYFMSGLPRSGSTVLSSILNQNPRFYSGPSSPVVSSMLALETSFSSDELFLSYPKIEQAKEIIASILPQYYNDRQEPVIFDKNRSWTVRMEYIPGYFNIQPKVICPVRDIAEILTSFISLIRKNPYPINGKINFIDEQLVKLNIPLTDDNRCQFLASPDGILGQSMEGIKTALMNGYDKNLHFVEYKDLINNPKETIRKIYEFLDEEFFEHDFDNLKNQNREQDAQVYGFSDMHEVRSELKSISKDPQEILSEEILSRCKDTEFWRILTFDSDDDLEVQTSEDPITWTARTSGFGENVRSMYDEDDDERIIGS